MTRPVFVLLIDRYDRWRIFRGFRGKYRQGRRVVAIQLTSGGFGYRVGEDVRSWTCYVHRSRRAAERQLALIGLGELGEFAAVNSELGAR